MNTIISKDLTALTVTLLPIAPSTREAMHPLTAPGHVLGNWLEYFVR
jgi:hypothetical protein